MLNIVLLESTSARTGQELECVFVSSPMVYFIRVITIWSLLQRYVHGGGKKGLWLKISLMAIFLQLALLSVLSSTQCCFFPSQLILVNGSAKTLTFCHNRDWRWEKGCFCLSLLISIVELNGCLLAGMQDAREEWKGNNHPASLLHTHSRCRWCTPPSSPSCVPAAHQPGMEGPQPHWAAA